MPRLYLSPSLQDYNLYAGGGTEKQYMNLLADELEPYLYSCGITFLRNDPNTQELRDVIRQSNASQIDLHLALHSNAAGAGKEGQLKGIEVYYNPDNRYSKAAAELMVEALKKIYPNPEKVRALPTSSLAEVLQVNAPSILLEVGYHDNPEEAQWIRENLGELACAIAKGLCAYFGIPFVPPQTIRCATVNTGGPRLNLRRFPSTESQVLTRIPNDSKVTLYSSLGNGWSVVGYRDVVGYASSQYLI